MAPKVRAYLPELVTARSQTHRELKERMPGWEGEYGWTDGQMDRTNRVHTLDMLDVPARPWRPPFHSLPPCLMPREAADPCQIRHLDPFALQAVARQVRKRGQRSLGTSSPVLQFPGHR